MVVDISGGGALVEGCVRLLPGTHVDAHVVTSAGRLLVRSRVTRCYVAALDAHIVTYRAALTFDRHVDTASPGYAIPAASRSEPDVSGPSYPGPLSIVNAA